MKDEGGRMEDESGVPVASVTDEIWPNAVYLTCSAMVVVPVVDERVAQSRGVPWWSVSAHKTEPLATSVAKI